METKTSRTIEMMMERATNTAIYHDLMNLLLFFRQGGICDFCQMKLIIDFMAFPARHTSFSGILKMIAFAVTLIWIVKLVATLKIVKLLFLIEVF